MSSIEDTAEGRRTVEGQCSEEGESSVGSKNKDRKVKLPTSFMSEEENGE